MRARLWVFTMVVSLLAGVQSAEAQDAFAGVWRAGNDGHYLWVGANWNDFKAKWEELSAQNLRLVDLDVYRDGGQTRYIGVWRTGSDAHYLWVGADWNGFKAKWEELSAQNLRLTVIKSYMEGGTRRYAGVWRAGSDGHYLWAGADWNDFKAKWEELSKNGLRLVDLDTYDDGNGRKYTGVWRAGNDAHFLWVGADWSDFKSKWEALGKQNLRLTVLESYVDGGERKYAGVWREGSDGYYLWAGVDFENFTSKWHELAGNGLRLIKAITYPGCGDCANQVVSNSGYVYRVTGHTTDYRWPVDEDGSSKYVRLSALYHDKKPFVLPFSNTSVKRWNGWLYGPGSWHHAHDYAIDLNQTFAVKAAAKGKVIFVGWDNWSGNTVVLSHNIGRNRDAYRTIYMHLRNGPANDCAMSWSQTVPNLTGEALTKFKNHLIATLCPQNEASRNPTSVNWGTSAQAIPVSVNQQVSAGTTIGWAGDTGPGGNGSDNASTNTHLHIFFARKDPTDNRWYFIDPYGIYSTPNCYPSATTGGTGSCARYPVAWKGGTAQYP